MSEPVKIAEDLQDMYKATKLGTIMFAVGSQIRELIERVSAAESKLEEFRSGDNYIKQFLDAKQKCAVMYPVDEVYSHEQLAFWAEEHGYSKAPDGAQEAEGK